MFEELMTFKACISYCFLNTVHVYKKTSSNQAQKLYSVLGLEFRALFISTVHNLPDNTDDSDRQLGFLSDSKLLNTAITRVKSHIAVIGNSKTLCAVGRCQPIWKKYLLVCELSHANSMFQSEMVRGLI